MHSFVSILLDFPQTDLNQDVKWQPWRAYSGVQKTQRGDELIRQTLSIAIPGGRSKNHHYLMSKLGVHANFFKVLIACNAPGIHLRWSEDVPHDLTQAIEF